VSGHVRWGRWLVPVLVLLDALAIASAMRVAWLLRFRWELGALETVPMAPFAEYAKPMVVLCVLLPLLFRWHGLYRAQKLLSGVEESWAIFVSIVLGTGLVLVLAFFVTPPHEAFRYSRLTFAYFVGLGTAFVAVSHGLVHHVRLLRYRAGLDLRRALVVGEPTSYLVEQLACEPAFGLDVRGFVMPGRTRAADGGDAPDRARGAANTSDAEATRPGPPEAAGADSGVAGVLVSSARTMTEATPVAASQRLGSLADLERLIGAERIEEVLIVEHGVRHRELLETIDVCERHGVLVHLVPPTYDLLVRPHDLAHVHGVPIIRVDERRYRRFGFLVKRLIDVVLSAAGLVALSPVFALIAILIKRGSPGPVIFWQERAGEAGQPFRMLKFRTMVVDAEARLEEVVDVGALDEPVFKVERDPRVTRVGGWLRRTSLDELPQLWNVLRGDMSLVGPRPEEMRMVERYDVWQRRRLKVRPGITGLQQVTARGSLSSLGERVRLDVYYVRNQSTLLDLWILLRTVWVVVRGKGAS
jgi:lipopolysaccharide/colanic/teichoic acid biosynthesis glycosyltransferase